LSGHEAKAAEHTNGELNQSKNETTAPSENKTTEKVDSRQLKDQQKANQLASELNNQKIPHFYNYKEVIHTKLYKDNLFDVKA
ncbi:hypothetical protein P7536_15425, partial [Staphylococcus aureus]|nr:hypothetical protein [Staphylococcus aureus]